MAVEQTFESLLQTSFQNPKNPIEVLNAGIGGERTDQALKRLNQDVIAKKPDIVIIMYGANDSYVDIGKTEPRLSQREFRQNLQQIVERLQAEKIRVILMTEPRWGRNAKPNGIGEHPNKHMEPFMEIVRDVARSKSISLVDHYEIWRKLEASGLDIGSITTDQLHPNPSGHMKIAESIEPVLKKLLD